MHVLNFWKSSKILLQRNLNNVNSDQIFEYSKTFYIFMRNCKTGSFDFKTPSNTLNAYTWPLKKYAVLELLIEFAY